MRTWNFYTTKELSPQGWVRRQLEIQAEGLSGNLDKVWRDVRDSAWIGGTAEGWERVPYWLDGFIPLAYLLDNKDMIARAQTYVDAILAQQKPSGWICPCDEDKIPGDTTPGRYSSSPRCWWSTMNARGASVFPRPCTKF